MARLDIIKDPVTGKQFSRDLDAPGSTYAPHTPAAEAPVASPTPAAPVPSPFQPKRTIDPAVAAAEKHLNTFTAPETADQIAERKRQQSSGLIDSINKTYDDEVKAASVRGNERLAMDNAISVMSGLMGSTEAARTRQTTVKGNDEEKAAINNKRMLDLSKVYTKISEDADKEAREQMQDATKSAEDILARRTANQTKAVENLKLMASTGTIDFDSFKNSPQNEKVFKYALDSVGGSEEALKGLFALNRPKETVIERKYMGNKLMQIYEHPVTGKIRSEVVDLGFEVPPNYTTEIDLGDRVMLLDPTNPDKKLVFSKGLTPSQQHDANKVAGGSQKAAAMARNAMQKVDELMTTSGKSHAIGGNALLGFGKNIPGSASKDFLTKLEQVKALLTLPNLEYMKGLGPMSEREFAVIQSASAALNEGVSEAAFDTEIGRVRDSLENVTLRADISPGEMLVRDKATGQKGAVPEGEFDPSLYDEL